MTVPPIPRDNTGIQGSVAYWKQLATPAQDIALDRLKGTLETLRQGHNSTLERLAAAEKRITDLEATMPPFPTASRGLWVAWGLANGQFTASQLASRATKDGYGWVALEYDDYGNAARWENFRDCAKSHRLLAGVWFTAPDLTTPPGADFVIAECEGPGDYQAILASPVPSVPRAICTNFNVPLTTPAGVPDPAAAEPLIARGYACLTECYRSDNASYTPQGLDQTARKLGWPTSQPVYSLYAGAAGHPTVEWYEAEFPSWQVGASHYLAEHLTW